MLIKEDGGQSTKGLTGSEFQFILRVLNGSGSVQGTQMLPLYPRHEEIISSWSLLRAQGHIVLEQVRASRFQ